MTTTTDKLAILIRLRGGFGLGDVVQAGIILKHLRKYRPNWVIDVRTFRGSEACLEGLCNRVITEDKFELAYDNIINLDHSEHSSVYQDRPSTKVAWLLQCAFNIREYDPALGRYECHIPHRSEMKARQYLRSTGATQVDGRFNVVLIHYQGGSSIWKKNLEEWQASELCRFVIRTGRVPVILEWGRKSSLPDQTTVFSPDCGGDDIWGGFGHGDAGVLAAMIKCSEAFIGIDSGPGKVASATDTPSLISWTRNHPIRFHDPAPHTTHLVPKNHREMTEVPSYFDDHYEFFEYEGTYGLVAAAQRWLATIMVVDNPSELTSISFVIPNNLMSAAWAMTKIRHLAAGRPADVVLAGTEEGSAAEFLKRFPFIRSVRTLDVPVLQNKLDSTNTRGRHVWMADGPQGCYHYLIPDSVLESGRRIEEWFPEYPADWDAINGADWGSDNNWDLKNIGPFAVFYLGSEEGNTTVGQNRGALWKPEDWVSLGQLLRKQLSNIIVVGTKDDVSYWEGHVKDRVRKAGMSWIELVGKTEPIGMLEAFKRAKVIVSYPSGFGVIAHYLGVPTVMWWRPDGDSQDAKQLVSFDERMASAWTNPEYADRYLPLIYKRETPQEIVDEVERRGWLK